MSDFIGPPEAPASSQGMGSAGMGLSIAGAVSSAIGAYYSVEAAKAQARSQASRMDYERHLAIINGRSAEREAQSILESGKFEVGRVGLQYAQVKEAARTRAAAGGIQGGVGSAAEVLTSIELSKKIDQLTITRNSMRAANAARSQRSNAFTRAAGMSVNAAQLDSSARGMSSGMAGGSSLLGGASTVARDWHSYNRTT